MTSNAIRWNIVNKNVAPGFTVKAALSRKVAKLQKHLAGFSMGTPYLQALFERMPKKGAFIAKFTLHLPSHILHAEKSADDLLAAIELASDALLRETDSLRSRLRGDSEWKRPARRARLKVRKTMFFDDLPDGNDAIERGPLGMPTLEENVVHS